MVPRMRHRVCLETLRRELQLVDGSTPSPSPSLAVKHWKIKPDDNYCDFGVTDLQSVSVGNKIPGFRTSAGMHKSSVHRVCCYLQRLGLSRLCSDLMFCAP
jgi:hypothetical protein